MWQLALAVGTAAVLRLGLCYTRKDLLVFLCFVSSKRKEDWREIWLLKTGPDTVNSLNIW